MMKKLVLLSLVASLLCSSAVSVSALRQRHTQEETTAETENSVASMTMEEYATQDYVENLPGKKKQNSIYDGYHYNGVPIEIPDFSRFKDYAPEDIKTTSDAIKDYLGWDILLGTSDYVTSEDYFYFKPIENLSTAPNATFGYGRKKFGEGEIKFKMRVKSSTGAFDSGWLGLCFRATSTQAYAWGGNPQYLLIIKPDMIEMQKWFNSQQMLATPSVTGVIKHDTWQEVSIVTKSLEQGIQIILTVDGVEYLNVMDTEAPFAPAEGYFMIHNSGLAEVDIAPISSEITLDGMDVSSGNTTEAPTTTSKNVTLEKSTMTFDGETQDVPEMYFENGSAMIPLRAVSNVLGGFITWNSETQTATVASAGKEIQFTNTYAEYVLNGEHYLANAKAEIKNGNLYVPAEILAKLFNAEVKIDGEKVSLTGK